MNREELLKIAKPILFNTEMVQAIIDNKKTVTRRVVKPQPKCYGPSLALKHESNLTDVFLSAEKRILQCRRCGHYPEYSGEGSNISHQWKPPYKVGDILYVREKFNDTETDSVLYAADKDFIDYGCKQVDDYLFEESEIEWKPSIHMPKSVARIFLKVTNVRVERLQYIDDEDAKKEGSNVGVGVAEKMKESALDRFKDIWNSTLKKQDLDKYDWEANPWVWVIEFERVEVGL